MTTESELISSCIQRRGSLCNLWLTCEIPADDELSDGRGEEAKTFDDDAISMLSYSEFSLGSNYSIGAPHSPMGASPKRMTNKRPLCKRIDRSSPLHRSHFESNVEIGENDSNEPAGCAMFCRVGNRWAPNEVVATTTTNTTATITTRSDSKSFLTETTIDPTKTSLPPPRAKGRSLPPIKLDHLPRFPTRRVSGGGEVPTTNSAVLKLPLLPQAPLEALKLDHCPRFPRRRESVEDMPEEDHCPRFPRRRESTEDIPDTAL